MNKIPLFLVFLLIISTISADSATVAIQTIPEDQTAETYCGDNICQANEVENTCPQDCSEAVRNYNQKISNSRFIAILLIIILFLLATLIIFIVLYFSKRKKR